MTSLNCVRCHIWRSKLVSGFFVDKAAKNNCNGKSKNYLKAKNSFVDLFLTKLCSFIASADLLLKTSASQIFACYDSLVMIFIGYDPLVTGE